MTRPQETMNLGALGLRAGILMAIAALALTTPGCPSVVAPTPTPSAGELTGSIALFSNIRISGDQPITIVYTASAAATTISAFYVEVAGTETSAAELGSEVDFATGLSAGTNRTVTLNAGDLSLGIYRIGLNLSNGTSNFRVLSTGTIEITELPPPVFTLPDQDLAVLVGTGIDIRASLGDPQNAVQWRLFVIDAGDSIGGVPADELGTEILVGAANEAIAVWNTSGLALGDYRVGISVTDSGQSIAQTVAAGEGDSIITVLNDFTVALVESAPLPKPPSVVVDEPGSNADVLAEETVRVEYAVTFLEGPPAMQEITVYYDNDGVADTGDETTIDVVNQADQNVVNIGTVGVPIEWFAVFSAATIDDNETIHFGVTADDGKNDPVTEYANGKVTRRAPAEATLTVTQPNNPATLEIGETVMAAWQSTGLPPTSDASYTVLVRRVDDVGSVGVASCPTANDDCIGTTGLPLATTSWAFDTFASGRFRVSVHLVFGDTTVPTIEKRAPAPITVSTLPTIIWVGDLATEGAGAPGAVFQGVQFEDNAGSAFAGNEDFDEDEVDEMIIVARYGKPEFVNPTGRGVGEAYMIRGSQERKIGEFNLNSTASDFLPGLVFSGMEASPTDDTDGISQVLITDDADGDGIGEIVFGFPFLSSAYDTRAPLAGHAPIYCPFNQERVRVEDGDDVTFAPVPQFYRGGAVAVSSRNRVIRTTQDDDLGRRVPLDLVGQIFDSTFRAFIPDGDAGPEPSDGRICSDASSWMEDLEGWDDGQDCDNVGVVGCTFDAADGEEETLVEPTHGFDHRLADPWACLYLPSTVSHSICNNHFRLCPACDHLCDEGFDTTCTCDQFDPDYILANGGTLSACSDVRGLPEAPSSIPTTCDPEACEPPSAEGEEQQCECEAKKDTAEAHMPGFPTAGWMPRIAALGTSFYREQIAAGEGEDTPPDFNNIHEAAAFGSDEANVFGLVGCRFVGRQVHDAAGTSITQSGEDLIVTAPFNAGADTFPDSTTNDDAGNAYIMQFSPTQGGSRLLPRYWQIPEANFDIREYNAYAPPLPHQYLAGGDSFTGSRDPEYTERFIPWDTDFGWNTDSGVRIIGDEEELIENVEGIPDFNQDGRKDIAVGAPRGDVDGDGNFDGAVYILYRRARSLEGNFDLADLKRSTADPERLSGLLVREELGAGQRFGEAVAGGFDFNQDGVMDVVVGNPDGNGNAATGNNPTGEVVIIFGSAQTISQQNGIPVEGTNGLLARRQGARIRGVEIGSEFGFTVANVGDLDNDGLDDLAIGAPNATPMFDSNPNDSVDVLDTPGLDRDLNGIRDDVTGPMGFPNNSTSGGVNNDANDQLVHAGLVYIILGSSLAQDWLDGTTGYYDISVSELGTTELGGFIVVGRRGERYADNTSGTLVHEADFAGGGFAGETTRTVPFTTLEVNYGGNTSKEPVTNVGAGSNQVRRRDRPFSIGRAGDVDGDGRDDLLIGAQLADPRVDFQTGTGTRNAGEAYLIYGFQP